MSPRDDDAENQLLILEDAMANLEAAASSLAEMEGKMFAAQRRNLYRRLEILERQAQFLRAKIH